MEEIVEFDWLRKDRVITHVKANRRTGVVEVENFTDDLQETFFVKRPHTLSEISKLFEDRCFERTNAGVETLLGLLGLEEYNPYDIVRRTRGRTVMDFYWIRFSDDTFKSWYEFENIEFSDLLNIENDVVISK